MNNKETSPVGDNWEDFKNTIYTKEVIMASNLRVALVGETIRTGQEAPHQKTVKKHNKEEHSI